MRRELYRAVVAATASLVCSLSARAQSLTAVQTGAGNQTIKLSQLANLGFTPIDASTIPGDGKLYIGQFSGTNPKVVVFDPATKTVSPTPFLSFLDFPTAFPLDPKVNDPVPGTSHTLPSAGQGMQGMTFSPNYNDPTKPGYHKFYTYSAERSTTTVGSDSILFLHPEIANPGKFGATGSGSLNATVAVLREWTANSTGTAIDTSVQPRIVLNFGTPAGHMGGGMKFGPDGYLYLSTGDGGGNGDGSSQTSPTDGFTGRDSAGTVNDVPGISNGQDFTNPTGKVLRIDPYVTNGDGTPRSTPAGETIKNFSGQTKYFIPNSNPFVGNPQNVFFTPVGPVGSQTPVAPLPELFAFGFRNPWKLSFDKNGAPGSLPFVADVGSRTREEIDVIEPGKNYGWPYREGDVISATAAGTRPNPIPYLKQVSPGVYAAYDLDPTLTDPAQMHGPIARLGTRSGSANPLVFADRPGSDIFADTHYGNEYGDSDAVVGGFIYRGTAIPELYGKYVFGGYEFLVDDPARLATFGAMSGGGRLFYFDPNEVATYKTVKEFNYDSTGTPIATNAGGNLMSIAQTENGELYALFAGGDVRKITPHPGWNIDGDGNWSVNSNWSGPAPSAPNAATYFGPVITAPRTVTVDSSKIVGAINLDSTVSYTLGGSTISLDVFGDVGIKAAVNVTAGTHTIAAPLKLDVDTLFNIDQSSSALYVTGTINSTGRAVTKNGLGLMRVEKLQAGQLIVNQGTFQVRARGNPNTPSGTSRLNSLSIGSTGVVDLTDNAMVIDYTTIGTLVADVRQHLESGRLLSSSADASHRLGYADNSVLHLLNFEGQSVGDPTLLVKFTYSGDTDLNGLVDATDLGRLSSHWQQTGVWTDGDLDYSGFVDIKDLYLLATTWQFGVGNPLPASSLGQALTSLGLPSVVPEPGSIGIFAMCALGALSRRSRRTGFSAQQVLSAIS